MDGFAKELKEQKRWRALFSHLQYYTEENQPIDTINLYYELLDEGIITHTVEDLYDNVGGFVDCVETWILVYTMFAFQKMEELGTPYSRDSVI